MLAWPCSPWSTMQNTNQRTEEHGIEGYRSLKEALACACMAKNATVTRNGFTANQRVFGSDCTWPSQTSSLA